MKKVNTLFTILVCISTFLFLIFPLNFVQALQSWTQVNTDGFGDANNDYVFTLEVYNSKLYAGTGSGAGVWEYNGSAWAQVNTDGFGDANNNYVLTLEVYNSKLYAGTGNTITDGEVWEYDGSAWTQVNTDGFGDVNNSYVYSLTAYNNRLYAGTGNNTTGAEVWEYNGSTWTQVNTDGFGDANNMSIESLAAYNNRLYAGTGFGAEVWEYNGSAWAQVNTDGFGDANNSYAYSLTAYNNRLYAGTYNMTGGEVWEYNGSTWTQVNTDGFGDANNMSIESLAAYNNRLYAGTGFGAEVWEYNGSAWAQVNTDGFGDANNDDVLTLEVYNSKLYAGTEDITTGGEVWSSYALANLKVTLTGPTSVSPEEELTYTITTKNNGPDDAGNIVLTINLPQGSNYNSCVGNGWVCKEGSLICTRDELSQGEVSELTLSFDAPEDEGDYGLSLVLAYDGILENEENSQVSFNLKVSEVRLQLDKIPIGGEIILPLTLTFFLLIILLLSRVLYRATRISRQNRF
ncbi:MAG: hypothetical protein O2U61_02955 [Candidatus Bathyarchaeota archaeon]|nr:hypothetical protein [Candidatus Bathyarchaeota archaeon]